MSNWRLVVPVVGLALVALLSSCGSGAQPTSAGGVPLSVAPSTAPESSEPTRPFLLLPKDGWYLTIVTDGGEAESRALAAAAIAESAAAAGFEDAVAVPYPGTPETCLGVPCAGDGPSPDTATAVLLSDVHGPSFVSANTTVETMEDWRADTADPMELAAVQQGLDDPMASPQVYWLAFSEMEPDQQVDLATFIATRD